MYRTTKTLFKFIYYSYNYLILLAVILSLYEYNTRYVVLLFFLQLHKSANCCNAIVLFFNLSY